LGGDEDFASISHDVWNGKGPAIDGDWTRDVERAVDLLVQDLIFIHFLVWERFFV